MGRITTVLIGVALLLGMLVNAPAGPPYESVAAGAPLPRVAVVGDSYTNGTAIGGQGPNAWPVRAFKDLAKQGIPVTSDVAAEGKAGYGVRGDQGNLFGEIGRAHV